MNEIKLFNTLSQKLEILKPLNNKKVLFYNCGITVYSHPHIGNWVGYIYWDVLSRLLEHQGYEVQRVQNITDVGHLISDDDNGEDKMEKGAKAEGITAWDVADKYIKIANHEAFELLKLKRPKLIRATSCIDQQLEFIKTLESGGFTYLIPDEGVYFNTSKIDDYGKLARLDIAGLKAGARVDVKGKQNITDFALWKFSPKNKTRDMEWESPWGKGFPGWHLECSVIAQENLAETIDIHAGGIDHIPVHHTNEIAQSESKTGKPFAKIWIHNNHLKVNGGKMSKSLGNIYTLEDVAKKGFQLDAFKLMVLSKHYRTEGNFTWDILQASQNRLNNWKEKADSYWQFEEFVDDNFEADFIKALSNDLETPTALSLIDKYFSECGQQNKAPSLNTLSLIEKLLGIEVRGQDINDDIKGILVLRLKSRIENDWPKSDQLRDQLIKKGYGVRDLSNENQVWYRL